MGPTLDVMEKSIYVRFMLMVGNETTGLGQGSNLTRFYSHSLISDLQGAIMVTFDQNANNSALRNSVWHTLTDTLLISEIHEEVHVLKQIPTPNSLIAVLKPLLMDLNEFSSIVWKVCTAFSSTSRHQKTTSNLLRITLTCRVRVTNERSLEGALYINLWWNSRGHPIFFLVQILKILMVSDKTMHKAFRIHN